MGIESRIDVAAAEAERKVALILINDILSQIRDLASLLNSLGPLNHDLLMILASDDPDIASLDEAVGATLPVLFRLRQFVSAIPAITSTLEAAAQSGLPALDNLIPADYTPPTSDESGQDGPG